MNLQVESTSGLQIFANWKLIFVIEMRIKMLLLVLPKSTTWIPVSLLHGVNDVKCQLTKFLQRLCVISSIGPWLLHQTGNLNRVDIDMNTPFCFCFLNYNNDDKECELLYFLNF